MLIELVFTLVYGFYIDRNKQKASQLSSYLQILSYVGYIVFMKFQFSFIFLQSFYKISWNLFDASFTSRFHTKIKTSYDPTVFACAKEMALCFTVSCILLSLSGLSLLFDEIIVFIISFLIAGFGIYILNLYLKD